MSKEHHSPKITNTLFLIAINNIGMSVTAKRPGWKWFNKEIQNYCKKWNYTWAVIALESWGAKMKHFVLFWSFDCPANIHLCWHSEDPLVGQNWQAALDWWVFLSILLFVEYFFFDKFNWKYSPRSYNDVSQQAAEFHFSVFRTRQ